MLIALIVGFLLGFIGSMPVAGPIAALVFARGAEGRFRSGVWVAVGGAVGEAIYVLAVFYGFSVYLTRFAWIVPVSRAAGAVILTALGITFLRAKVRERATPEARSDRAWPSLGLGLTLTLFNPTLIVTWTAAVTTLYTVEWMTFSGAHAWPFAGGAFAGIASWFMLLLVLIRRYRERFSMSTLRGVVRVVGVFLLGLAAWFVVQLVQYLLGAA